MVPISDEVPGNFGDWLSTLPIEDAPLDLDLDTSDADLDLRLSNAPTLTVPTIRP